MPDECLSRLRGIAAATGATGAAVEKEGDACPRLHDALRTLGLPALDEVEVAEKASDEPWEDYREAKGLARTEGPKRKARTT